jgi:hypothetical protein
VTTGFGIGTVRRARDASTVQRRWALSSVLICPEYRREVLQLAADAEDWKRLTLLDTKGKALIDVRAKGRLRRPFGLSELFIEASEPSVTEVAFSALKKRFPNGRHRFRAGSAGKGRRPAGADRLSFEVPGRPR